MSDPVTVTIGGTARTVATPLDAIRVLIGELPNGELSGLRLLAMVRAESRHRQGVEPVAESELGKRAVQTTR